GKAVAGLMRELAETGAFRLPDAVLAGLRDGFASARASEAETAESIRRTCQETGQIVCPHTAVGLHAARACRGDPAVPMIALATAHAAKFPDAVEAACGLRPALPERLAGLMERPERITVLPAELSAIQTYVREHRT
ncbi:MAG: threonine synthase, partial [Alphaproteobacteria bacterium]